MSKAPSHKIRLAHVVRAMGPAGKELGILKLIHALNKDIFDVYLIVTDIIYEGIDISLPKNRLVYLECEGLSSSIRFKQLKKVLKENEIDIVHTHSWNTLIEGVTAGKLAKVPVIIHQEHGTFPQKIQHKILQHLFWRWADIMLSVSGELGIRLAKVTGFPEKRIKAILNGVKDDRFYPDEKLRGTFRQKFGIAEDDFVVGTVGRMTWVKNQAMLLRAGAEVLKQGHNIQIVVAGHMTNEVDLAKLVDKLGMAKNTHILGYQSEVNMILNGFDIFALTSFSEGCSNVIQEAMFTQRTIVATNVGGNSELVTDGKSGLLVENDNHQQLADAIIKLKMDAELRKNLADNAREHALQFFPLSQMVANYEKCYLDSMAKK